MKYRYIILLGGKLNPSNDNNLPVPERKLRNAGMVCKLDLALVKVFMSADTPTLAIPRHGLIIGRVFTKGGQPISRPFNFNGSQSDFSDQLVQNTWGEYLALHIDGKDGSEITLLRDPSGSLPCVYSLSDGEGFITSDIGLAVELGLYRREVNWQAIAHSLNFPYLQPASTALRHVSELLPGSTLTCHERNISTHSAWSPWHFVEEDIRHKDPLVAARDVRSAVSGATTALSSGVDRCMVELSGGLDSSIVASCMRHASPRAIFCTLVMPVAGTDERPYARLVTDALGDELFPVEVGFGNIRVEFPVPPSSVVPAIGILQNAVNEAWEEAGARHGVNSFFSGAGGDTIFCYLKTAAPAADAFMQRGIKAGMAAIDDLAALHLCTVFKAARLTLRKIQQRPCTAWKEDRTLLNRAWVTSASEPHPWMDSRSDVLPGDREKIYDLIGTQSFTKATPRGAGRSMHFPLLSQPVMEACLRVPTWMWIADGRNRAVARQAFADRLPRGILDRRSKGSYTGYMAAVYTRNKQKMREFLEDGQLREHDLLDRSALASLFAKELVPRDLSFLRIFDLCAAENWARQQS